MNRQYRNIWILWSLITVLMFSSCDLEPPEYHIFTDISECKSMENTHSEPIKIETYDSPDRQQSYIEGLSYSSFYGAKYQTSEFQFEIYAFEFVSPEDSKEYFEKITGKTVNSHNKCFSASGGMTRFRIVAIDGKNAYTVYAPIQDSEKVTVFINSQFSVPIT